MKSNLNDGGDGPKDGMSLNDLLAMSGTISIVPKFRPEQKVWLRCGDQAGMVLGVVGYPDRYAYIVRWPDGTKEEYSDYELTDSKIWGE